MSSKSKFSELAGALKERAGGTAEAPKLAKSKDRENYRQTTAYVHKDVYDPLQSALASERKEYSQLVEDLLRGWLKKRGKL